MSSSSSRSSSTWSVPRLAPLPEYSELPPDMSFLVTERARRFTTITLKEVRYPSGCPCHPKDEETVKLYERLGRAASPDGRPALYVRHSRPELTERSNSSDSTNTNESSTNYIQHHDESSMSTENHFLFWNKIDHIIFF